MLGYCLHRDREAFSVNSCQPLHSSAVVALVQPCSFLFARHTVKRSGGGGAAVPTTIVAVVAAVAPAVPAGEKGTLADALARHLKVDHV